MRCFNVIQSTKVANFSKNEVFYCKIAEIFTLLQVQTLVENNQLKLNYYD